MGLGIEIWELRLWERLKNWQCGFCNSGLGCVVVRNDLLQTMLTSEITGHPPRRIRRSLRDHVPPPPIRPAHHRSLRDGRTLHHVRFCSSPVRYPQRLLWLSQRPFWRHWRRDDCPHGRGCRSGLSCLWRLVPRGGDYAVEEVLCAGE
jgi:hypothetical protein